MPIKFARCSLLGIMSLCLAACDKPTSPNPSQEAPKSQPVPRIAKPLHSGGQLRTVTLRPRNWPDEYIRYRSGTPWTHPERWHTFGIRPTAALVPTRAPGTRFSTMSLAATDTLFGYLDSDIGSQTAEVSSSTWATEHNGDAAVEEWVYPATQQGMQLWEDAPAQNCHGAQGVAYCSIQTQFYFVDCTDPSGAGVKANAEFDALYTNGAHGSGTGDTEHHCSPGGSASGSGDQNCTTSLTEESDDGGQTWYVVDEQTTCDP